MCLYLRVCKYVSDEGRMPLYDQDFKTFEA